jgi:hypothetical protein
MDSKRISAPTSTKAPRRDADDLVLLLVMGLLSFATGDPIIMVDRGRIAHGWTQLGAAPTQFFDENAFG